MGEMKGSINFHYTKGNIEALTRIANDSTIDEEDRIDAKKFIEEIKQRNTIKTKAEDRDER